MCILSSLNSSLITCNRDSPQWFIKDAWGVSPPPISGQCLALPTCLLAPLASWWWSVSSLSSPAPTSWIPETASPLLSLLQPLCSLLTGAPLTRQALAPSSVLVRSCSLMLLLGLCPACCRPGPLPSPLCLRAFVPPAGKPSLACLPGQTPHHPSTHTAIATALHRLGCLRVWVHSAPLPPCSSGWKLCLVFLITAPALTWHIVGSQEVFSNRWLALQSLPSSWEEDKGKEKRGIVAAWEPGLCLLIVSWAQQTANPAFWSPDHSSASPSWENKHMVTFLVAWSSPEEDHTSGPVCLVLQCRRHVDWPAERGDEWVCSGGLHRPGQDQSRCPVEGQFAGP